MAFISLAEYARRHGRLPDSARQKAQRGGFKTATKIGRDWLIDEDEPYEVLTTKDKNKQVDLTCYDDALKSYAASGSIKETARVTGLSEWKVRKILVSAGIITSDRTTQIVDMYRAGKTLGDIAAELKISRNAVMAHIPYSKTAYNLPDKTPNAQRIAQCRARKEDTCQKTKKQDT